MSRSRKWCFTIFNYDENTEAKVSDIDSQYLIYGRETCPSTGKKHLQGFVYFRNARTLAGLKKIFPAGTHLEIARGTVDDNVTYCSKENDFVQFGEKPMSQAEKGESEKKRWKTALDLTREGKISEVDPDIYIRYAKNLEYIQHREMKVPDNLTWEQVDFRWYWGATGTGKSTKARTEFPDAYLKDINKWWDNYKGEEAVIIDEWRPDVESWAGSYLKRWADIWTFSAERKGGRMTIRPRVLIVTSNYDIDSCFQDPGNRDPLKRRFKQIEFKRLNV